jgi:hypothetical protein
VAGGPLDALARPQGARRTGGTRATENAASGYLRSPDSPRPGGGTRDPAQRGRKRVSLPDATKPDTDAETLSTAERCRGAHQRDRANAKETLETRR